MTNKAKKRGNNEGTIYQRKDGKWCGQISIGRNENGTLKRKTFYGKTRKEVSEKVNAALTDVATGTFVDESNITLNQWLNTWLFEYKKSTIRPTTFGSYEYLIRVHIIPSIGFIKLNKLRPEHLQRLYNEKLNNGNIEDGSGLSPRTVKYIHIILNGALKQALKSGLVLRNVADATIPPRQVTKERRVLTINEQSQFIKSLENERLRCAFLLALASGIREGELLALTWNNVDLENGIIKIRQTLKRVKDFDDKSKNKTKIVIQDPKTNSSKRDILIPQSIINELKIHRKKQLEAKLLAGALYNDLNFVFSTELGKPFETSNFLDYFYKAVKKSGLKDVNFHALRHSYATRLLEANTHPKIVQELLGHSDISTTLNIYSHVMPEIKKAATEKINFLFQDISIKK